MYVQYGCGLAAPKEWVNFDASLTLKWERTPLVGRLVSKNPKKFPENVKQGDIVKGLPVPTGSCHGVYASHVLEHLTLAEFYIALDNTRTVLRRGGIFRLVVPDLEWAAREYIRQLDGGNPAASLLFLERTGLGRKERTKSLRGMVYHFLKTSVHDWMWDSLSLQSALAERGFCNVRRCYFGDCEDPNFALVEDVQRFENAIAIEARA